MSMMWDPKDDDDGPDFFIPLFQKGCLGFRVLFLGF